MSTREARRKREASTAISLMAMRLSVQFYTCKSGGIIARFSRIRIMVRKIRTTGNEAWIDLLGSLVALDLVACELNRASQGKAERCRPSYGLS